MRIPTRLPRPPSTLLLLLLSLLSLLSLSTYTAAAEDHDSSTFTSINSTTHRNLNVYGWPDRRSFTDPQGWPGRVVGKLEFPDRQYCTGSLVGPSLILTARHCFADLNERMVPARMDGKFMLGYSHGSVLASAGLVHVYYGQEPTSDWAIVRIDRQLGKEFGHLIPSSKDITQMLPADKMFSMTAFSRDKYEYQAGTDPVCSIKAYHEESRLMITSCSGEAGASGAAIIDGQGLIHGVFVAAIDHDDFPKIKVLGDFDHRFPNFATPAAEWYGFWTWAITQPW